MPDPEILTVGSDDGSPPSFLGTVQQVVAPAIAQILRDSEVDTVVVSRRMDEGEVQGIYISLEVGSDHFECSLWQRGELLFDHETGRARLEDFLQDFVAESSFAWGELRPVSKPYRPEW